MQKVYLLLRGNQQNGPYNLEELLQFDLKPVDLIWIEGKSAGWYYPQEIKELAPYLPFVNPVAAGTVPQNQKEQTTATAPPKKVFVSMPANAAVQSTASEVSLEPPSPVKQAPAPALPLPAAEATIKTTYARSLEDVETDYTAWVYNESKKKKTAAARKKMAAAAIVLAAGVMVFAAIHHFSSLPDDGVTQNQTVAVPVMDSATTNNNEPAVVQPVAQILNAKKQLPKPKTDAAKTTVIKAVTSSRRPTTEAGPEMTSKEETKPVEKTVEETPVVSKEDRTVLPEAPKEKKKKLKEKILDLFKKKEPPVKEEAKGVEVEDGERRSVHRQSDADLAGQVRIKFTIPNDWMMGIKGAKISVTNKSAQTIAKATIDVLYYNEDNELLQTKTVSLGKIAANGTGTVSIPDHPFADHVEYKIILVQGAGEPLASR